MKTWLDNLKEGDPVLVMYHDRFSVVSHVHNVTKNYVPDDYKEVFTKIEKV